MITSLHVKSCSPWAEGKKKLRALKSVYINFVLILISGNLKFM